MGWSPTNKCPYLSRGQFCRMAGEVAGLPSDACRVTPRDCAECQQEHEPTAGTPNSVVTRISLAAVQREQPERVAAFEHKFGKPAARANARAPRNLQDDFPCVHRAGEAHRQHTCTPCQGTIQLPVYQCGLLKRECTVFPAHATASDGLPCEVCVHCEQRIARKPGEYASRTITYLTTPGGRDVGPAWANRFRGQSVFLLCGGPSTKSLDLSPLTQRGIMVAAVNNAGTLFRPHLWFFGDRPGNFHPSMFADPAVAVFAKSDRVNQLARELQDGDQKIVGKVRDFPNVFAWQREDRSMASVDTWLSHPLPHFTIPPGCRSILPPTLRMLIDFGFRDIYLLGCDFNMQVGAFYAFDEQKDQRSCDTNNRSYVELNRFFTGLQPKLAEHGVNIVNCTPGGNLTAFPRMNLDAAVTKALDGFPQIGSVFGYYWSHANLKKHQAKGASA